MADAPAPSSLPPVKLADFEADREQFADGIWRATVWAIGALVVLLLGMLVFLV